LSVVGVFAAQLYPKKLDTSLTAEEVADDAEWDLSHCGFGDERGVDAVGGVDAGGAVRICGGPTHGQVRAMDGAPEPGTRQALSRNSLSTFPQQLVVASGGFRHVHRAGPKLQTVCG
jgi:hypothetical protein